MDLFVGFGEYIISLSEFGLAGGEVDVLF